MITLFHNVCAIFIFAPFLAFIFFLFVSRKRLKRKALGFSADITTFLLFASVPVSMEALWNIEISFFLSVAAIVLAIFLLIIEWKKTKEIEVLKYIRKTWRLFFVLLSLSYLLIWISGLALTIINFA